MPFKPATSSINLIATYLFQFKSVVLAVCSSANSKPVHDIDDGPFFHTTGTLCVSIILSMYSIIQYQEVQGTVQYLYAVSCMLGFWRNATGLVRRLVRIPGTAGSTVVCWRECGFGGVRIGMHACGGDRQTPHTPRLAKRRYSILTVLHPIIAYRNVSARANMASDILLLTSLYYSVLNKYSSKTCVERTIFFLFFYLKRYRPCRFIMERVFILYSCLS